MASPRAARRRVVEDLGRKPPEIQGIRVVFEPDPFSDEHRSPYRRGECRFVCGRAEAEVVIEGITQLLTSAGLYGIESDSEETFFESVAGEEWTALRNVLKAVGVPTDQLPIEVDRAWVEWRM